MALKRWAIPNFVIDSDTELLEAQANEETVLFSMLLSNNEAVDDAVIEVKHTDGFNVIFQWKINKTSSESPTAIDSVIVLAPGDKILVRSDKNNVAVMVSGEAK